MKQRSLAKTGNISPEIVIGDTDKGGKELQISPEIVIGDTDKGVKELQ